MCWIRVADYWTVIACLRPSAPNDSAAGWWLGSYDLILCDASTRAFMQRAVLVCNRWRYRWFGAPLTQWKSQSQATRVDEGLRQNDKAIELWWKQCPLDPGGWLCTRYKCVFLLALNRGVTRCLTFDEEFSRTTGPPTLAPGGFKITWLKKSQHIKNLVYKFIVRIPIFCPPIRLIE